MVDHLTTTPDYPVTDLGTFGQTLFRVFEGNKGGEPIFVALRTAAPVMILEGRNKGEVIEEGCLVIHKFCQKMHNFGFRNAQ